MDQPRSSKQFQYSHMEPKNEELQSSSHTFMSDTLGTHPDTRTHNPNVSEVKPGLNFSIQTGEEFAFEFMHDRVNQWKPLLPNTVGDPNYATGYMELKGMLGISHTGSESGSDISMLTMAEKGPTHFEPKSTSLHEGRSIYTSVQSVPRTSLAYESSRGVVQGYTSSSASDSSSLKMKILCSFGGKILPRPSDGKLRYVGGETRIVRIRKDISWQELTLKALSIYNQTHVIKYQLPGEDLDALVSVSCDEDLQNMMEECNELEHRESSQKLRIFLFSMSDLEDAQFGLGGMDGDSEVHYMVAVNGMDLGLRNSSNVHNLVNSSANNLEVLGRQSIEKEKNIAAVAPTGVSNVVLASNIVSAAVSQSPEQVIPSSANAYENHPHYFHGQMIQHGENMLYPPHNGHVTGSHAPFIDGSVQQASDLEKVFPTGKEYFVPTQPYDNNSANYLPVEDVSVTITAPEGGLHALKNEAGFQDPNKVSPSIDSAMPPQAPKISEDDQSSTHGTALAPGYIRSDSTVSDQSYPEPPVIPQRVYYSERIPREQVELLNRSSKSDDSYGSPFLISQQVPKKDGLEKLHKDGNLAPHIEQSTSTSNAISADTQKDKEFADSVSQSNTKPLQNVEGTLKQALPKPVDNKDVAKGDSAVKSDQDTIPLKNARQEIIDESATSTSDLPAGSQITSVEHHVDPALNQPERDFDVVTGINSTNDDPTSQGQPSPWTESSNIPFPEQTSSTGISASRQGDIVIDIEDRFPRDLLSDIFSKAILSEDSPGFDLLHKDAAGLSINMENHEPKPWSYFQQLAQGFAQKDVSLIDQDLGFSSELGKDNGAYPPMGRPADGILRDHVDQQPKFGENNHNELPGPTVADSTLHQSYDHSQVKDTESTQFGIMMKNLRMPESEYEDGNFETRSAGLPPLDPSLGDLDISTLQVIKNEDLEELRELGSGTFGTVYHGKWRGTDVAIKRIKKSCFTGRSSEQQRLTIEFWREADILSKLHHPNVVAFYGVVQDGPGGTLATVAEFMVDGSLRHVLLRKDRYLDRRKRLIIAMDAAFGMEYLHSKNIVHFDLKCDNLLVNLKDPLRPICKVGDFGLSKIKRNTLVSGGVRGTLPWMAPELLNGSSNKVSEKVDVFSFGIVLWEILTGEEPYANMHYGAIIGGIVNNTLRPTIPSYCDPEWRTLMEQCWAPNPAVRPSFTEITSRLHTMSAAASQTRGQGQKAFK